MDGARGFLGDPAPVHSIRNTPTRVRLLLIK
jgi:hypothetical protein